MTAPTVPCPRCNATPGDPCRQPNGRPLKRPHRSRLEAAGADLPKMGRPRSGAKGGVVSIYGRADQWARLDELCAAKGVSRSAYIWRALGLGWSWGRGQRTPTA